MALDAAVEADSSIGEGLRTEKTTWELVEAAVLVLHTKQMLLTVWLDNNCMKTWVSHANGL